MEKEILEYRKASAKWMELPNWNITIEDRITYDEIGDTGLPIAVILWEPDTDLNQMGMIEDKLIKEGCAIGTNHYEHLNRWCAWIEARESYDKSKPIAFMKAFMEYYNQNNKTK